MTFERFTRALDDEVAEPAPWLIEDLVTTPTWDVLVDEEGDTYQGIIQNVSFQMKVEGGHVEVPYNSILKVDVVPGGFFSRADEAVVVLRTGEVLRGFVEKSELTISRMGHERSFLLRDLVQVCPSSSYFTEGLRSDTTKNRRPQRERKGRW